MALCPRKYLIKHLMEKSPPIDVWLQGTIEQTVGVDILIISDTTGRAKITKCETADGIIDKHSLKKVLKSIPTDEVYSTLFSQVNNLVSDVNLAEQGTAIKTKGLPEVQASKFVDLTSQPQMKIAWEAEVNEANLFFEGKLLPTI